MPPNQPGPAPRPGQEPTQLSAPTVHAPDLLVPSQSISSVPKGRTLGALPPPLHRTVRTRSDSRKKPARENKKLPRMGYGPAPSADLTPKGEQPEAPAHFLGRSMLCSCSPDVAV